MSKTVISDRSGILAGDRGLGGAKNPVQNTEGFGRFSTVLDAASKDAEIMEDEPVIVDSGLSQEIEVDGYTFEINIYRLEGETAWTLEVVDEDNTSHIWDDIFASDFAALVEAQKAIRTVGAEAFMHDASNPTLH